MNHNFEKAFKDLIHVEGGYVNHPNDPGKETYKGVSRVYHPNWLGWSIIDKHKPHSLFPRILEIDDSLKNLVKNFYKIEYWDSVLGDKVSEIESPIASELFDTAVNMGPERAVIFLQRALNVLNTKNTTVLYNDVSKDGDLGPITLEALQKCCENNRGYSLLIYMNVLQGARYIENAEKNRKKEVFIAGWAQRINLQ